MANTRCVTVIERIRRLRVGLVFGAFATVLTLVTISCGMSSVLAIKNQTNKTADMLQRDLGSRPDIGINVSNGRLSVNVIFPAGRISERRVSEVEAAVRQALHETLSEMPARILVSVQSDPNGPMK